jgi:hypothetical protein
MDSRKTTDGDGDERTTENVVRLPRDWLGPREELVPIGSRARAAETPDDAPPESLPPTAASFWDEDSGSLQAPMQAPADAWHGQWAPASPEPATRVGSTPTGSAPTLIRRIPRPRRPRSLSGGFAPRRGRGTAAVAGVLGACLLVVLAVIGETAGGTHTAHEKTAASAKSAAIVTATGVNRARLRAQTPVVTEIKTEPPSHHGVRSPTRKDRTQLSNHRHRHGNSVARSTPSASQPARSTAPATAPTPTTSTPSSGSTSSSPPASSARSTSRHQPAFGPNGSLGPGSSPDG